MHKNNKSKWHFELFTIVGKRFQLPKLAVTLTEIIAEFSKIIAKKTKSAFSHSSM